MSIQFRIRSKVNKHVSIKVRLSHGRGNIFEKNTGFTILPSDWSETTNLPKQTKAENKQLSFALGELDSFIQKRLNESEANGILIDSYWLERAIIDCFSRVEKTDSNFLTNHLQYIIDTAPTRRVKKGGKSVVGLSKNTVKNYKMCLNLVLRYESILRKKISFLDINNMFIERFANWLLHDQKYSVNYSGKNLEIIKTAAIDAQANGIKVNPHATKIVSFREHDDDRYIQTLSFEEIEQIKNTALKDNNLINARKWLVIGCEIAQRGGDLLDIKELNVRVKYSRMYVDVHQGKTDKKVTVGVSNPEVQELLIDNPPFAVSPNKLNKLLKELCKECGLTQLVEGTKLDPKIDRKVLGTYPKYELITTHCFRRSFATNYYGLIPTPFLMQVTGHTKESIFLIYINKRQNKDMEADQFMDFYDEVHRNRKTAELKIAR